MRVGAGASRGGLAIPEEYAKGHLEIVVEVTTLADANKFNLVLRCDPSRRPQRDAPAYQGRIPVRNADFVPRAKADDTSVFIRARQREDGVESWIPCLAYVQRLNECDQIGMDIAAPPFDFRFEVIGGFANWEVDSLRVLPAALKRGIAQRLVKRMLQVVEEVVSDELDSRRYWLSESQAYNFFACFVVEFFDKFVTARVDEIGSKLFKLGKPSQAVALDFRIAQNHHHP
ncbi:MAG TPA: hypothetical protein DEA50_16725 [Parvularcula sp.]|nr:hypothetical protein [Parvularcula sp.]